VTPASSAAARSGQASLVWVARACVALAVLAYVGLRATAAPPQGDGGLELEFLQMVHAGQQPFVDFVDLYGPLHWRLPALAYGLAGEELLGTRLYLVGLKLCSIGLATLLALRLGDRFAAGLVLFFATLLLGLPWGGLQVVSGFQQTLPLVFGTWALLLLAPGRVARARVVAAGVLTAVLSLCKVSDGALLFAGVASYLAFVSPQAASPAPAAGSRFGRRLQAAGLVIVPLVFLGVVGRRLDAAHFSYLLLPPLLAVGLTALRLPQQWRHGDDGLRRAPMLLLYIGTTGLALATLLGLTLGPAATFDYFAFLADLIPRLQYPTALPPMGEPTHYVAFNEWYWTQVPLLLSLLLAVFGLLQLRAGAKAAGETLGAADAAAGLREARILGLALLTACSSFALYSCFDEMHVLVMILTQLPALAVLTTESIRRGAGPKLASRLRVAITVGALAYGSLLLHLPQPEELELAGGDWSRTGAENDPEGRPHLSHIRFDVSDPAWRRYDPKLPPRSMDEAARDVAALVDRLTADGGEVLVMIGCQLVPPIANARSVGGRYRYLFYGLRMGMLDRVGFHIVAPPKVLAGILADPPAAIVGDVWRRDPLLLMFPEFQRLIFERYTIVQDYGIYRVYRRKDSAPPALGG